MDHCCLSMTRYDESVYGEGGKRSRCLFSTQVIPNSVAFDLDQVGSNADDDNNNDNYYYRPVPPLLLLLDIGNNVRSPCLSRACGLPPLLRQGDDYFPSADETGQRPWGSNNIVVISAFHRPVTPSLQQSRQRSPTSDRPAFAAAASRFRDPMHDQRHACRPGGTSTHARRLVRRPCTHHQSPLPRKKQVGYCRNTHPATGHQEPTRQEREPNKVGNRVSRTP